MPRKVITQHDRPPIPTRKHDWSAFREDYDLGDYIATGATPEEAIHNLLEHEDYEFDLMGYPINNHSKLP